MVYKAKVEIYKDFDDEKIAENYMFIYAEDYKGALETITDFYGEDLIKAIHLTIFSPDDFIIFGEENKKLFKTVDKTLSKDILW